jgi:L-ascorbate metabolism protein UlaG (beta-lactamase superfamily)
MPLASTAPDREPAASHRREAGFMVVPTAPVSSRTADAVSPGSLEFIGNATVLLRAAGLTLLTDPDFVPRGERIPLGYGLHTTRLLDPALRFEALPRLDAVVLSHLHEDHFDRIARTGLDRTVPILTTAHAARALERDGFVALRPLGTWQAMDLPASGGGGLVRVTAMPGRHAPSVLRFALPPTMGSLIEWWSDGDAAGRPDRRVYISGDTLWYEGLRAIRDRVPELDVAVLHLGGTRVLGLTVTMDGEQGARLASVLGAPEILPIHHEDYEAFKSPVSDFVDAARRAGLADRVRVLRRGERHLFGPD